MRHEAAEHEWYRIVARGEFGDLLRAAFADVRVTSGRGRTVLLADVRDGQELFGLMDRLRDHGIRLEEVRRVDDEATTVEAPEG